MPKFFQLFLKRNVLLAASPVVVLTMVLEGMPSVIPYTVQTSSMVLPVSEWTLSRAQNGDLVSTLKDNRTGKLSAFSASVFQRGNQANFQLNPNLYQRAYLNKGDTVASLFSNQDHEQLVQLQGQLAVQKAELQLDNVGQKPTDVESRFNEVALAKQELATQRLLTDRTVALYQDSLASRQEYEVAINKLRVRELNVQTMTANYKSAATGERPEQLQVIRTRIRSLQQQIHQIQHTLKDLTLTSPVSGTVLLKKAPVSPAEEVVVAVADNSAYVMLLPVRYSERDYVQLKQKVEVAITGTTQTASGEIIGIDNAVQLVDGRQAFFVTALVTEKNLPLVPGMVIKTTVWCQPISLKDHIARVVHSLFVY
jgi:hypothetical protein